MIFFPRLSRDPTERQFVESEIGWLVRAAVEELLNPAVSPDLTELARHCLAFGVCQRLFPNWVIEVLGTSAALIGEDHCPGRRGVSVSGCPGRRDLDEGAAIPTKE